MRNLKNTHRLRWQRVPITTKASAVMPSCSSKICHTKAHGGKPFELIDWQGADNPRFSRTLKPNGYRQFNTAYIGDTGSKGKSELAAAVTALHLR